MFDVVKREIFRFAQYEMFSLRSNVKSSFGSQCTLTLVGGDVLDAPKSNKLLAARQVAYCTAALQREIGFDRKDAFSL